MKFSNLQERGKRRHEQDTCNTLSRNTHSHISTSKNPPIPSIERSNRNEAKVHIPCLHETKVDQETFLCIFVQRVRRCRGIRGGRVISSRSTSQRVSKRLTGPGSPRTIFPSKYETNRNTSDGRANDPPAITLPVSGVGREGEEGCR